MSKEPNVVERDFGKLGEEVDQTPGNLLKALKEIQREFGGDNVVITPDERVIIKWSNIQKKLHQG